MILKRNALPYLLNFGYMKWKLISKKSAALQEYHLMDNNDCTVVLKYNPLQHSARISSGEHHSFFFLDSSGHAGHKMIFRNQYGVEMGSLLHDRWHSPEGVVQIDKKKYHYQLNHGAADECILYENNKQSPLLNCEFTHAPETGLRVVNEMDESCQLLGLCWFLLLPIASKLLESFAA